MLFRTEIQDGCLFFIWKFKVGGGEEEDDEDSNDDVTVQPYPPPLAKISGVVTQSSQSNLEHLQISFFRSHLLL